MTWLPADEVLFTLLYIFDLHVWALARKPVLGSSRCVHAHARV
jgi:hypothetical protein